MSVQEEVVDIIVEQLGVEKEEVTPEKSLIQDFNADSLDLTELIMTIEERFGFEIREDQAEKINTVGDIINFVEAQKK